MSPVATYFVQAMVTLLAIVALAVLALYGGRRLGLGRPTGPVELVGRLPLDPRRAIYLVRVGKLVYVVGASEGGLTRLGEMDADSVPTSPAASGPSFAEVLGRLVRRQGASESDKGPAPGDPGSHG